jgi:hypothetical protein
MTDDVCPAAGPTPDAAERLHTSHLQLDVDVVVQSLDVKR